MNLLVSMDEDVSECMDVVLPAEAMTDEQQQQQHDSSLSVLPADSVCRVCGDSATGMYFGALVCVPCKTFFLRYATESLVFSCKYNGSCVITPNNRTQCKYCRYQKCVEAGMTRRVRPMHVQLHEGQHMCAVCNDVANGIHFGALTCEGCKKFFRRGLVEHKSYSCKSDMNCVINPRTRNACRYCRYVRCLAVGMSRDAIQMGRPSKHRLQTTASLRQRDMKLVKLAEDSDENGWHGQPSASLPSRPSNVSVDAGGASDGLVITDDGMTRHHRHEEMKLSPMTPTRRSRSFSSDAGLSVVNSDSNSSFTDMSPDRLASRDMTSCYVKTEQVDSVPPSSTAADKQFTVSWTAGRGANEQHVLSGGYCCERNASLPVTSPVMFVADNFCRSPTYVSVALTSTPERGPHTHSDVPVTVTCVSPDSGVQRQLSRSSQLDMSMSPSSKWHIASDRDSPYVSVMALASSCQLFSESCPTNSADDDDDTVLVYDQASSRYWLEPDLPDENVIFTDKHCEMINQIAAAYDRYVQTGAIINETLVTEMKQQSVSSMHNQSLSEWIQMKVIPVYTVTSITYCKSLPGFVDFCAEDQATLIRLGQSSTRILAACIHWYDAEHMDFKNFLSWRSSDLFKMKSVRHAQRIHALDIDHIEAALLNVTTLIATDYPGLRNAAAVEELRRNILNAFRAYTTAKFGTPNQRIETLFSYVPEIRSLGMLHYKMTKTLSLQAEEVMKS